MTLATSFQYTVKICQFIIIWVNKMSLLFMVNDEIVI